MTFTKYTMMVLLLLIGFNSFANGSIRCNYSKDQLISKEQIRENQGVNHFYIESEDLYETLNLTYCSAVYHGDLELQIYAINQLAFYNYSKTDYSVALDLLEQSIELSRKINFTTGIAEYHCYMGLIGQKIGNNENAMKHYRKLLQIGIEHNEVRWEADAYINIGSLYVYKGNLEDGEAYLLKAINLLEGSEILESKGWANSNLAEMYRIKGDTMKALFYYNKTIKIWEENNSERGLSSIHNLLGKINENLDLDVSKMHHQKALKYAEKSEFKNEEVLALFKLGELFLKSDIDSSIYYLDKVIESNGKWETLELSSKASQILMDIYKNRGDQANYIKYLEINCNSLEGMLDFQNNGTYQKLRLEQENKTYITQKAKDQASFYNKILSIGSFVLLVFILFLAWSISKFIKLNNRFKIANKNLASNLRLLEKQSHDLASKNKELSDQKITLTSQLANKLQMVRDIQVKSEKLKETIVSFDLPPKQKNTLVKIINDNSNEDLLSNIDQELENVNSSLFAKLLLKHPSLTSNNLKLLSYIKMHLSNKEIAHLLYISSDSVKVAKNRLKKRLNVPSKMTLELYLHTLDSNSEIDLASFN